MKNCNDIFDNASFLDLTEIKEKELLGSDGFILGRFDGEIISDNSYKNVLLLSPSGHDKVVSMIMPNLLSIKDSLIVHDIKMQSFELTHKYRENILNNRIFTLNLSDKKNSKNHYNPLDLVFEEYKNGSTKELDSIMKILLAKFNNADIIINDVRNLIKLLVLSLNFLDTKDRNFAKVFDILNFENFEEYLNGITNNFEKNSFESSLIGYFLRKTSHEIDTIKSISVSVLKLWSDKHVRELTSETDFDINDFRTIKSSLYIGIEPTDINRFQLLTHIFYGQFLTILCNKSLENHENGVVIFLDEFPNFGKFEFIKEIIPYSRDYKLKIIIISQNIDQLRFSCNEEIANYILSNCSIKIVYHTNNYSTVEYLSKIIGFKYQGDSNDYVPLLKSEEIINMPSNKEIILIDNRSFVCNRIFYYEDEYFIDRIMK